MPQLEEFDHQSKQAASTLTTAPQLLVTCPCHYITNINYSLLQKSHSVKRIRRIDHTLNPQKLLAYPHIFRKFQYFFEKKSLEFLLGLHQILWLFGVMGHINNINYSNPQIYLSIYLCCLQYLYYSLVFSVQTFHFSSQIFLRTFIQLLIHSVVSISFSDSLLSEYRHSQYFQHATNEVKDGICLPYNNKEWVNIIFFTPN